MKLLDCLITGMFLASLIACGGSSSNDKPDDGGPNGTIDVTDATALTPPSTNRDWLTKSHLDSQNYPHFSPIHNDYFMPVGDYSDALHSFSGTVTIQNGRLTGDFTEYRIAGDESFKNFPQVELSFVSDGQDLIPINRDRQLTLSDDSFWGIILEPGKVWSEADDQGWSRASFPFTFISARRNGGHNGIATFLFNDTEVSYVRLQIVQETALWFRNDMYAQLSATYQPRTFDNATTIIENFQQEVLQTVEIRDWDQLTHIGTDPQKLTFNSQLKNSDINQTAFIKDNIVYMQPCYTRYGNYPYCRWMRNGAYSMTKSLGASLTMMRLAQLYGEQVYDLEISNYLDVSSNHNGWNGVTFGNLLNMAAGIGDNGGTLNSGDIFADENQVKLENMLTKNTAQEKLTVAFSYGNYSWGPGVEFRYNSALTFVLAAAMDSYYKTVAGDQAHLWQMIVEQVFNPIGIQHVPMLETNEANNQRGIAELFHGLYPNVDDMAKLSMLLQNDGIHNGEQVLHFEKLREALFKTDKIGLHSWWADNEFGESRYLHGFWTSPFTANSSCSLQVPYMSGYGGNIFTIFPNGTSAFRFADAERYSPYDMVSVSHLERALCE